MILFFLEAIVRALFFTTLLATLVVVLWVAYRLR